MQNAEIGWFTLPVGVGVGYGYAAVCTIRALQRKGLKVTYDSDTTKVHISFIQPEFYSGLYDQYRIGYTPWESTVVPDSWIPTMKSVNEMWTTSTFCKEVFESYGINAEVVPHGIDNEVYPIIDRSLADRFVFFHIGGPTERKGGQKVVDAFLKIFDNAKYPDVYLLMKSNGPSEARWRKNDVYMGNVASHPKIQVITAALDEDGLSKLYGIGHCMVYPTNGEGFGLIPFQAIATGMPTICTNATACADYAPMSIPLDYKWVDGTGVHLGQWAEPDFDDLCDKMLYAYESWETEKKRAMQSARIIQETQSWDHVSDKILSLLGDKIYEVL